MPWLLPLLALLSGTSLQRSADRSRDRAISRGTARVQLAEDQRQRGFDKQAQQLVEQAQTGITAEDQTGQWDAAAQERQDLYADTALAPAEGGYQTPAGESNRVVAEDAARQERLADVFTGRTARARAELGGYGDMGQRENLRLAPVMRAMARNRTAAQNSASLLPQEMEAAIARGMAHGRNRATWGQLLSTIGAASLAGGGIPLPRFAAPGAVTTGSVSAAPGLIPEAGLFPEMSLAVSRTPVLSRFAAPARAPGWSILPAM